MLPVKNSYLLTFSFDKADILAVFLSNLYQAVSIGFVIDSVGFLANSHFLIGFS